MKEEEKAEKAAQLPQVFADIYLKKKKGSEEKTPRSSTKECDHKNKAEEIYNELVDEEELRNCREAKKKIR